MERDPSRFYEGDRVEARLPSVIIDAWCVCSVEGVTFGETSPPVVTGYYVAPISNSGQVYSVPIGDVRVLAKPEPIVREVPPPANDELPSDYAAQLNATNIMSANLVGFVEAIESGRPIRRRKWITRGPAAGDRAVAHDMLERHLFIYPIAHRAAPDAPSFVNLLVGLPINLAPDDYIATDWEVMS
jgi:hypothetical protein